MHFYIYIACTNAYKPSHLHLHIYTYTYTGATILYATHIFDGLDDWPTHLHYLTNTHTTGWQGKVDELPLYAELRSKGEPSPLL